MENLKRQNISNSQQMFDKLFRSGDSRNDSYNNHNKINHNHSNDSSDNNSDNRNN